MPPALKPITADMELFVLTLNPVQKESSKNTLVEKSYCDLLLSVFRISTDGSKCMSLLYLYL